MSTSELKINLINKITEIRDEGRLKELMQLIEFQSNSTVFKTSKKEKEAISEAKEQIRNGEVVSNEDVQKEIKEWLEK